MAGAVTSAPALADKLAFLGEPGHYPDPTRSIETVETHMSWVFLTDDFAYKLKKPVCYDFLDFSTLEARRRDCEDELRLNGRLAATVYLEVVPLVQGADGRLSLGGTGQPVEWLVKMRRLPAACMLDQLIARRALTPDAVRALGRRLAAFYAGVAPEPISAQAYRIRLAERIAESRRELGRPEFGLPDKRVARIARRQSAFVEQQHTLLDARAAQHRIVEGHGDMRPEHVCLTAEPSVIDCPEFRRDFRILDPVDELGYLALECERLGMPEAGTWLLTAYEEASGDAWPPSLLHFYQSCRASLRAKLAIWHLRDDGRQPPQRWVERALAYLELAERHIGLARP